MTAQGSNKLPSINFHHTASRHIITRHIEASCKSETQREIPTENIKNLILKKNKNWKDNHDPTTISNYATIFVNSNTQNLPYSFYDIQKAYNIGKDIKKFERET